MSSFIQQLVVANPANRLGAGNTSALMSHAMFTDVEWSKVAEPSYISPLISTAAFEASHVADSTVSADVIAAWEAPYVATADSWVAQVQDFNSYDDSSCTLM